jgi:hypothetical protein
MVVMFIVCVVVAVVVVTSSQTTQHQLRSNELSLRYKGEESGSQLPNLVFILADDLGISLSLFDGPPRPHSLNL